VSQDRDLPILEAYDERRDVVFLKPPEHVASLVMKPGCFGVFYPHDIHRPGCRLREKCRVRKIVLKVAAE
jgi:YhcH/YjgK/YiaL family protein